MESNSKNENNIKMNEMNINCFHGRLSRKESELRLRSSQLLNCYLLRESDRKPLSYVLSYLGSNLEINHFRIQYICGNYYFGAKHFSSFQQLIHYYSKISDLLRNQRLIHPISPKEPIIEREKRFVSILPYNKMPETDELSFRKGDHFILLNDLQNGWYWCRNERTQESGLVFNELLQQLSEETIDSNESYLWFHSKITKEEAVEKLAKAGPGSFLVRPSDNSPGNYSLFFHVENSVQRFRIERHGNRYLMGGRIYKSLEEVIERYKSEQIVEGFYLRIPVLKSIEDEFIQTNNDLIYTTIRESRETQLLKSQSFVRFKGFLYKKSSKNSSKKWKKLFFVLNSKESILYYYLSETRTKPKGLIDLQYSYLYSIHDSLFERQNCFQIVERALPCISTIYYLSSTDLELSQEWVQVLKPFCLRQMNSFIKSKAYEMKSIYLSLICGQNISLKLSPNPFIYLTFNGSIVKVAKSQIKSAPNPQYEEEFILDDIPIDVQTFHLILCNQSKHKKDTEIAETIIELSKLKNGEEFEEWFQLSGLLLPLREDWGQLRIRLRFNSEIIMPLEEYMALKDLLLREDLEVIQLLEDFLQFKERTNLSLNLLKISKYFQKEKQLLKQLIEREVHLENDVSTLFRANSLTTSLIDYYMKSICHEFLQKSLLEPLTKVLDSKSSCELNPSKLDSPQSACQNAEHLLSLLDLIIDSIFKNSNECPKSLRFICYCLQRSVSHKWPKDFITRTRVIGGFIFLRLICPAILNPRQFNLINEIPSETASRSLILIAKSLQNLANLNEFGTKSIFISDDRFEFPQNHIKREPWMEIVNPFILKNKNRMIKYLDDLAIIDSSIDDHNNDSNVDSLRNISEPARELAAIHSICEQHFEEIIQLSQNRPTLKKLLTVIEMLTKHKKRYQNEFINNSNQ